jgi:hypothetical protein
VEGEGRRGWSEFTVVILMYGWSGAGVRGAGVLGEGMLRCGGVEG